MCPQTGYNCSKGNWKGKNDDACMMNIVYDICVDLGWVLLPLNLLQTKWGSEPKQLIIFGRVSKTGKDIRDVISLSWRCKNRGSNTYRYRSPIWMMNWPLKDAIGDPKKGNRPHPQICSSNWGYMTGVWSCYMKASVPGFLSATQIRRD